MACGTCNVDHPRRDPGPWMELMANKDSWQHALLHFCRESSNFQSGASFGSTWVDSEHMDPTTTLGGTFAMRSALYLTRHTNQESRIDQTTLRIGLCNARLRHMVSLAFVLRNVRVFDESDSVSAACSSWATIRGFATPEQSFLLFLGGHRLLHASYDPCCPDIYSAIHCLLRPTT